MHLGINLIVPINESAYFNERESFREKEYKKDPSYNTKEDEHLKDRHYPSKELREKVDLAWKDNLLISLFSIKILPQKSCFSFCL